MNGDEQLYGLGRTEIENLICWRYRSGRYRKLLRMRFIDGRTYAEILMSEDEDYEWRSENVKRKRFEHLVKVCGQFKDFVARGGE